MKDKVSPTSPTLPAAALRALEEAEERRRQQEAKSLPVELGGVEGYEPTEHGDWQHKGIASDFS